MALSDTYRGVFADDLFKQTQPTPPTTLFYSFHSSDPGTTGANELSSGSSPGYARAELDPDPDVLTSTNYIFTNDAGQLTINNNSIITWPVATDMWNSGTPFGYWGLWDALSGGNFILKGTLNGSVTILAGQTPQCIVGNMTITLA